MINYIHPARIKPVNLNHPRRVPQTIRAAGDNSVRLVRGQSITLGGR